MVYQAPTEPNTLTSPSLISPPTSSLHRRTLLYAGHHVPATQLDHRYSTLPALSDLDIEPSLLAL